MDEVLAAFRAWAEGSPEGVWAAPGRVNLIGEHTDYNDGFALPVAVDRRVLVAARRRADDRLRCWSRQRDGQSVDVDLGSPAPVSGWAAYPVGVARVLRDDSLPVVGADLVIDADLPAEAGLASSAALATAVAMALADLFGLDIGPVEVARVAWRAEREAAGVPCGVMDPLACVLGRRDQAVLLDARTLTAEMVPFDLSAAGLVLLVIDTGVRRRLADGAYAARRRACEEAARRLGLAALRDATIADVDRARAELGDELRRRAAHVVTENARVLAAADCLRAGAPEDLGPLLGASHRSLRDDFEVSCPELDTAVEAATSAGAVGARLTGAGFGGCALALVPVASAAAVGIAVKQGFVRAGFGPPTVLQVETADGAHRVA